jgi:hypothetical protein
MFCGGSPLRSALCFEQAGRLTKGKFFVFEKISGVVILVTIVCAFALMMKQPLNVLDIV